MAIAETDKAIALDPDHTPAYANKAINQVRLNRLDDALLTVRRASERKLESATMLLIPYFVAYIGRFGGLYPIYVRGLAYLAARQPGEAVGEFERTLDHRGIVIVDPMDGMARLGLARALVLAGDTANAKSAYSDLLTQWKNADPDIPALEQARASSRDFRKRLFLCGGRAGSRAYRTAPASRALQRP